MADDDRLAEALCEAARDEYLSEAVIQGHPSAEAPPSWDAEGEEGRRRWREIGRFLWRRLRAAGLIHEGVGDAV